MGSTYTGIYGAQQSTYRNCRAERWGNPGKELQPQVRLSSVPATAWRCWVVRALQSHGGDRKVGGKQDTLPGPYCPPKHAAPDGEAPGEASIYPSYN